MDYKVEEIEDQLVATVEQAAADSTTELYGIQNIATHTGTLDPAMWAANTLQGNTQYFEGLIQQLPFIWIRYNGRKMLSHDESYQEYIHDLSWTFYVAASSLRAKQEAQRSCYGMLRGIFDAIHGKWPYASTVPSILSQLTGNQITNPNFKAVSPIIAADGQDEKLIGQQPLIAAYQTTYTLSLSTA